MSPGNGPTLDDQDPSLPNRSSPPSYEHPKTTNRQSSSDLVEGLGKVVETDFDEGNQVPKSPNGIAISDPKRTT